MAGLALRLVALLLAATTGASAQVDTAPIGRIRRAAACPYDACALRLEAGKVLQGAAGRKVAGLGAFSSVMGIEWSSDSARRYARSYQGNHTGATVVNTISLAASLVAGYLLFKAYDDARDRLPEGQGTVGLDKSRLNAVYGVAIGSALFRTVGGLLDRKARRQLSRAVWWHNRELAR
jgi:hypothetical protein